MLFTFFLFQVIWIDKKNCGNYAKQFVKIGNEFDAIVNVAEPIHLCTRTRIM